MASKDCKPTETLEQIRALYTKIQKDALTNKVDQDDAIKLADEVHLLDEFIVRGGDLPETWMTRWKRAD